MTQENQSADLSEETLNSYAEAAVAVFTAATNLEELAAARSTYLGEKSPLALARRALGTIAKEKRKEAGRAVNIARGKAEKCYGVRKARLEEEHAAQLLVAETIDVSQPSTRQPLGAQHPITMIAEQISDILIAMGCRILSISLRKTHGWCCGRILLRCRFVLYCLVNCLYTSVARDVHSALMN